ncbi:hypothetical protein EAG_12304 [Camponotus floridanus]|uniref:Uncharacterized protein n=2 Tax=Camponotus floridanus TaxID=104421 RepID=E2AWM7_CAMFO|nr:hypothetical protein EAG_12304 [Camponotus floridanus]
MAEETPSSKEVVSTSKVVTIKKNPLLDILSKLKEKEAFSKLKEKKAFIRLIKNWIIHLQQWLLIMALNAGFNLAWGWTYDFLFGVYGMTPIPYFPNPILP